MKKWIADTSGRSARNVVGEQNIGSNLPLFDIYNERSYRTDIQGLRAVSAFLIMVYHVWLNRVSGGVDVFFVISGFFMTGTLLRMLVGGKRIRFLSFWARIFRRALPSAFLVLIATLALTVVLIPPPLWKYSVNEFIASAAQVENLELMRMKADYLAREAPPSQFQQFWALSIQMQFYLVLPFLVGFLAIISRRRATRTPLVVGFTLVILVSFAASLALTASAPAQAYFNPVTRLWEFLTGGLIAVFYPDLKKLGQRLPQRFWNIAAWVAACVLVFTGLTLGAQTFFPGWVALLPVVSAVALLISGQVASEVTGVATLLSWRPLVYVGGFAFTLYLWHWPILVFAHHTLETTSLSFLEGLAVIFLAIVPAALTRRFVEEPIRALPMKSASKTIAVFIVLAVALVGLGITLRQIIYSTAADYRAGVASSNFESRSLALQTEVNTDLRAFISVDLDRPKGIGCIGTTCSGGDTSAEKVMLLVGASHAAQWYDVFDTLGSEDGLRVVTRLGNTELEQAVRETSPDFVVTTYSRTSAYGSETPEEFDTVRLAQLRKLAETGITVIAIRDNPRFGFYQNACVWQHRSDAKVCAIRQIPMFSDPDPTASSVAEITGLYLLDFSDLFCQEGLCPAVHDDVLMYYDKHHLSKSYLTYIENEVLARIRSSVDTFN